MSLTFNGNTPNNVTYNGNTVEHLVFNGSSVWEKEVNTTTQKSNWLTFTFLESGTVGWYLGAGSTAKSIYYKKNSGSWTSISSGTTVDSGATVSVSAGDTVQWRGTYNGTSSVYAYFTSTAKFKVSGNIQSIYKGSTSSASSFNTNTSTTTYLFHSLFKNCTNLVDASSMVIPHTGTSNYCYQYMFQGCTALKYPPKFTDTGNISISTNSCQYMFQGCTALLYTPTLNITNIRTKGCYYMFDSCSNLADSYINFAGTSSNSIGENGCCRMFYHCDKLVNLHITSIPNGTVGKNGMNQMYRYCSFEVAPELPATTINERCYYTMFSGNTKLKTVQSILPATTLYSECYRTMFSGCTNLENAPILPATTLQTSCYHYLFTNCKKINYIKCLATTNINSTNCNNWVSGVASSGTFVKNTNSSWEFSVNGIPSGWTVQTATS